MKYEAMLDIMSMELQKRNYKPEYGSDGVFVVFRREIEKDFYAEADISINGIDFDYVNWNSTTGKHTRTPIMKIPIIIINRKIIDKIIYRF